MSLSVACEEYLRDGAKGDSDILLVAVSKELENGSVEEAAETLMQDKHKTLLTNFGWDFLSLFVPRFLLPSQLHTLQLINQITQVCSPKEMCLALLEQMELLKSEQVFVFFLLLQPLKQVLRRLQLRQTVDSSLNSVRMLLRQHYPTVASETTMSPKRERATSEESLSESEEQEEASDRGAAKKEEEREGEEDERDEPSSSTCTSSAVTVPQAVSQTLNFLQPFLDEIHSEHSSKIEARNTGWSSRQRQCVSMLFCLLDYPLLSHNLSKTTSNHPSHQTSRELADRIVVSVVKCHCGAVDLLSWRERVKLSLTDPDRAGDHHQSTSRLSTLGQACFAYLLLAEEVNSSYLPSILNHGYLFHISIPHVKALMERPERRVIDKGLTLLDALLHRVPTHSLPSHTLDESRYLDVAVLLTNLMVSCQHKKIRHKSVPLLRQLINKFNETGRHRMYRKLLRSVTHAGVRGLLVHDVKNEVDLALKSSVSCSDEPFLGLGLMQLLNTVTTVSSDEELLSEIDRIMPVLNFIRYLLIRDKPETNMTGIWDASTIDDIRSKFVDPLRKMVVVARAHSKQELETKTKEGRKKGRGQGRDTAQDGGPEVNVEVMGSTLPKLSLQEELKMIHLAGHQFDMLDSVLVRVEELLESRTTSTSTVSLS